MLRDLIERAQVVAPGGFQEQKFRWPPEEIKPFDVPFGEIEPVELPAGASIRIEGRIDSSEGRLGYDPSSRGGLDTLAWYRSYHFGDRGWGIYITEAGVRRIAHLTGGDTDAAYDVLWGHEYFHFLADVVATFIEVEARAPSYLPHYHLKHRFPKVPGHDGWCHVAEGLANGYALDSLEVRTHIRAIQGWMKTQPVGYKRGPSLERMKTTASRAGRDSARQELVWHLISQAVAGDGLPPEPSPALIELAHWLALEADVPLHWISDRRQLRPVADRFIAAAAVATTPLFDKRISTLGLVAEWDRAKEQLARDAQHPGLRFKKLKGEAQRFSIRLGRGYRCLLRLEQNGTLLAEDADKRSDVYR